MQYRWEIVLYVKSREFSRSRNSNEKWANSVARWHCAKSESNTATVIHHDPITGIRRKTEFKHEA